MAQVTKKYTVTFRTDSNLSQHQVKMMLLDALSEFRSNRGPSAREYVNRRYPNTPGYAWLDREKKITEVMKRQQLADDFHQSLEMGPIQLIPDTD